MATVQDLIEFLRDTADDLEFNYDSSTPLKVSSNTYRMSQHILGVDEGFVDLNDPVDEDAEMEWPEPDEEEEDEEVLEEKKGHPSEEKDECFLGLNEEDENLDEYGRKYSDVAEEGLNEYTDNEMDALNAGLRNAEALAMQGKIPECKKQLMWVLKHEGLTTKQLDYAEFIRDLIRKYNRYHNIPRHIRKAYKEPVQEGEEEVERPYHDPDGHWNGEEDLDEYGRSYKDVAED